MAAYKYFDLNDPGDPPPWGVKEVQAFKDIIDTLVSDTLGGGSDVSGHKHTKLYNGYGEVVVDADNTSISVALGGNPDAEWGNANAFRFSTRGVYGAPAFVIEGNAAAPGERSELFKIEYGDGNDITIMGGSGSQRMDIRLKDSYADAFRLRVDEDDILNVSTATRIVTLGSPAATNKLTFTSNGDVYTRAWTDITNSCTFNGFLDVDPVHNKVWIRQVGGLVFVQMTVQGTSDNNFMSIQFPFQMQGVYNSGGFYGYDGSSSNFEVVCSHNDGSSTLSTSNFAGSYSFWNSSGGKGLGGSFVTSVVDPQFAL